MENNLKVKIEDACRSAMKNREELLLSVLRLLLTAIHNREIEKRTNPVRSQSPGATAVPTAPGRTSNGTKNGGLPAQAGAGEMTDEEIMAVIRSEAKKRKDAIAEFTRGGRAAAADKESAELAILERYLPPELSDEEIEKLLLPLAKGATMSDFGKIMAVAMKAIAGRASGDRVSGALKRALSGEGRR